jgi:LacI family transcriptional regulator
MSGRVTITDLAKAADVSVSTVDRILNRRGPVQRTTAEHVLVVAEKIGFQGLAGLRRRLAEEAPERTFGFLVNRRERHLYGSFAKSLVAATTSLPRIQGRAIVRHLDDLSPDAMAEALLDLGKDCDAVAGVCVDHPRVNMAVTDLAARGVPFWAMLSDLTCRHRAGFVGANGWKLGRSAGWFMSRLCTPEAKVAVLIGSGGYLCQREFEGGFRGYLKDTGSGMTLVSAGETGEDDRVAEEIVGRLLKEHPDLTGIFMGGGGVDGIVAARRQAPGRDVKVVSTELSENTERHLVEGMVDVALSHAFAEVAKVVASAMEDGTQRRGQGMSVGAPVMHSVPMQVAISENV